MFTEAITKTIAKRTLQPANSKTDFYAVVTGDGGLHHSELWRGSLFFVLAGGSTVETAICDALFHLSCHKDAYSCLAMEIRKTFSSSDEIRPAPKLTFCTYLHTVINESLRMTPLAPGPLIA
ncbi:hypothetical protein RRF57_003842 [Xylaria bambusicola]|uniref:Cytochrome P450 n=1 Tax=Xylaria bambusicola TaxID=326684 RepID=A0AAN7Z381_9PEZI